MEYINDKTGPAHMTAIHTKLRELGIDYSFIYTRLHVELFNGMDTTEYIIGFKVDAPDGNTYKKGVRVPESASFNSQEFHDAIKELAAWLKMIRVMLVSMKEEQEKVSNGYVR